MKWFAVLSLFWEPCYFRRWREGGAMALQLGYRPPAIFTLGIHDLRGPSRSGLGSHSKSGAAGVVARHLLR